MELLANPKSKYLLDAGLEILHEQSIEWLNDIDFWRDELVFFYSLVVKKTLKAVPIEAKNNIEKIESELISITDGELDILQHAVEKHEQFLSCLLDDFNSEENYREKHRELTVRIELFALRLKTLKKEIFNLVKLINKNKENI